MNKNLKLKDMPDNERPIEKLLMDGAEELTNSELLAVILRTGIKGENILSLSNRIISNFNGLDGLLYAGLSDITSIKGVKKVKGSQILALIELSKRFNSIKSSKNEIKISSPNDIVKYIQKEMSLLNQEVMKLIMLNTKNIVIASKNVFKGSLDSAIVHPREIYNEAIKKSSASIIICHNHPSGDSTPSREDIDITIRLIECGKILGIKLLDHIIIGKNNYISLKEKGII